MVLQELGGGGYDDVQSTAPSNPSIGDTWFDQSASDGTERQKIYADVGNGPEWVVIPTDTDLRFALTPDRVDAGQRQTYLDNFGSNRFVNSKTAMENVSSSPTVMDELSGSQSAMTAVSKSRSAMTAVAAGIMPRTKILLSSYYDSIFSADVGSYQFYDSSTIDPNSGSVGGLPYTYNASGENNGSYDVSLSSNTPTEFDGEHSLSCQSNDLENNDQAFAEIDLDLSAAATLEYWVEDEGDEAVLLIDGSSVNNMGRSFSWTKFSIDVSGYSGVHRIGLGSNFTTSNSNTTYYTGLNIL